MLHSRRNRNRWFDAGCYCCAGPITNKMIRKREKRAWRKESW